MSEQSKCDRCQTKPAMMFSASWKLCVGCECDLEADLLRWRLANESAPRPVVPFEILPVGSVWRKIYRAPEVVDGRLTGAIKEIQIDLAKRTFYRLIDRVTGETERRWGNAISTDLQSLLPYANDRMVVEEFDAWVALKDGEI